MSISEFARNIAEAEQFLSKRWVAHAHYQYFHGSETEVFYMEELSELQELIEGGPDWRNLAKIEIKYLGELEEPMDTETTLRPPYVYEAIPVTKSTFDSFEIGDMFNGGEIMDGLAPDDQHLLIVRYKA